MSKLVFRVTSDWQEVVRLRKEIEKLKQELLSMNPTQSPAAFKALNTQLFTSTQRMNELVVNAAKAGAVMENDLKRKIDSATKASDELSEEIIKQRKIIRETAGRCQAVVRTIFKNGQIFPAISIYVQSVKQSKNRIERATICFGRITRPAGKEPFGGTQTHERV